MADDTSQRYEQARAQLEAVGQAHLLTFYDELTNTQQAQLLDQIDSADWPELARLVETHVLRTPELHLPDRIDPAPWYPHTPTEAQVGKYAQARELGLSLIREGKTAVFTVAGGQGTRLGWDGPKGTFPATPIRGLPLFGCFAEYIRHMQDKLGARVPWYIMTSPINDAATREFFQEQQYFGLDPEHVMLFPQQMMPTVDMQTGKVLLADKDTIAMSPNGHGGSLKALYTSGAIADMLERGVEQISYIQVDNPIVRALDPLFIGLHAMDDAQMSSKMLPKRDPFEKLGNFCVIDGKMTVIEYSDLPDDLAVQKDDNGQLRFLAGSIAIHALRVDFVEKLNTGSSGIALPFHRAEKKVPYIDIDSGSLVEPDKPNAVKLEMFVFDALPLCTQSIIYETSREDEFAPIKNASGDGVLDSPDTSKRIQIERAGRWLEQVGVSVPRNGDGQVDAVIEISQYTAVQPEDLEPMKPIDPIERGSEVVL